MKRSIYLLLVVLAALVLSACTTAIGTDAHLTPALEHKSETIGAVANGP
jgi:CHAT domain-containing protein